MGEAATLSGCDSFGAISQGSSIVAALLRNPFGILPGCQGFSCDGAGAKGRNFWFRQLFLILAQKRISSKRARTIFIMTKEDHIKELTAQIDELERQRDNFIQEAYQTNREAIALGNVSSVIIRDEAHNSFPDTPKIERMEKELEALMG